MPTLFDLRQTATMNGEKLKAKQEELNKLVSDPTSKDEDILKVETEITSLEKRFNISKSQLDKMENEMKEKQNLDAQQGAGFAELSKEDQVVKAKAEFYRHALMPNEFSKPSEDAQRILLHAIPAGNETGGDKLLPTTVSKEIITEPFAKNPLRDIARMTNIKGLELPRLSYTLDNDDFILDTETAHEMQLKGDSVKFGQNKFKVYAAISDTVLHGSDLDLVNWVENALRSGLAAKERKDAFATSPKSGLEHMSFYEAGKIKSVSGKDVFTGIMAALADLHEDYRENAKIVMRYADYQSMLLTLSNGTTSFFNTAPETIFGKEIVFSDSAVNPIVGDFNYFGINYENTTFDTDKDVKKGEYLFVLTAWYDQVRTLDAAFRIVNVSTLPAG
ncbi:phage major capsid protein [Macrococcus epidermidis]|uniref:Phage major capsid protein n=1 Tax=Macrococcus epidermidis TaxID=1902580 RepID=A0A327ZRV8_9STAP|nr:phage major capsid protein [Macrococcus epidermidis]RAK45002.1 phage major capsid protein [Macrococcus epidermidis]